MKTKAKSKLEECILAHLTPEGNLLDLENKSVTPEHMRLLCQAGDTLNGVKQLYLSNNGLGDAEIEFLFSRYKVVMLWIQDETINFLQIF